MPTEWYFCDANVSGPTDPGSVWTNDANGFDGNPVTATSGSSTNVLQGQGLQRLLGGGTPSDLGGWIYRVTPRARIARLSATGFMYARFYSEGNFASGDPDSSANVTGGASWAGASELRSPAGGWTWANLNNIGVEYSMTATSGAAYWAGVRVDFTQQGPIIEDFTTADSAGDTVTSLTMTAPSGISAGDLLVVGVGSDSTSTTPVFTAGTGMTGFTKEIEVGDGTADAHWAWFWKVATGSEGDCTVNGDGNEMIGIYLRISGAHPTSPIHSSSSTETVNYIAYNTVSIGDIRDCLMLSGCACDGADLDIGPPFGPGSWIADLTSGTSGNDCEGGVQAMYQAERNQNHQFAWQSKLDVTDGIVVAGIAIAPAHQPGSLALPSSFHGKLNLTR